MRPILTSITAIIALASVLAFGDWAAPLTAGDPKPGAKVTQAEIEKLVADLGSPIAIKREEANRTLRKIGEPALPALKAALQSENAEQRRRAEVIHAEIIAVVEERNTILSISKATKFGIDHLVERMVADRANMKKDDWELLLSIANVAQKRGVASGAQVRLASDFMKFPVAASRFINDKTPNSECGYHRILAESITAKLGIGPCMVLCNGPITTRIHCAGSILFINGDADLTTTGNCVIVCAGNLKINSGCGASVIVCNGDFHAESGVHQCAIYSNGKITVGNSSRSYLAARDRVVVSLPGAVYLSEIQEHAKDCISWMRFFSPALFGVTSIAKAKQVQITELSEHSQLRKAGIVENDIVLAVGKAQIATEREFRDSLRMQITTGRTEFTIRRANMVMTFSVALK